MCVPFQVDHTVPVITFSVPKAGDFVDTQAALVTGDMATRMRVYKEDGFRLNGFSSDRVQNALTVRVGDTCPFARQPLRGALPQVADYLVGQGLISITLSEPTSGVCSQVSPFGAMEWAFRPG